MVTPSNLADENEKKILYSLLSGPKRWRELKQETKLSDRTLAKRLKSLIRKGMITEEIDEKDRRVKIYRITKKGVEASISYKVSVGLALKLNKLFDPYKVKNQDDFLKLFSYLIGVLAFASIYHGEPYFEVFKKSLEMFKEIIHDKEYKEQVLDQKLRKKIESYIKRELPIVLSYLVPTPKEEIEKIEKELEKNVPSGTKLYTFDRLILDFFEDILNS